MKKDATMANTTIKWYTLLFEVAMEVSRRRPHTNRHMVPHRRRMNHTTGEDRVTIPVGRIRRRRRRLRDIEILPLIPNIGSDASRSALPPFVLTIGDIPTFLLVLILTTPSTLGHLLEMDPQELMRRILPPKF